MLLALLCAFSLELQTQGGDQWTDSDSLVQAKPANDLWQNVVKPTPVDQYCTAVSFGGQPGELGESGTFHEPGTGSLVVGYGAWSTGRSGKSAIDVWSRNGRATEYQTGCIFSYSEEWEYRNPSGGRTGHLEGHLNVEVYQGLFMMGSKSYGATYGYFHYHSNTQIKNLIINEGGRFSDSGFVPDSISFTVPEEGGTYDVDLMPASNAYIETNYHLEIKETKCTNLFKLKTEVFVGATAGIQGLVNEMAQTAVELNGGIYGKVYLSDLPNEECGGGELQ
ncbi:MAG: hypothetical protein DWQ01_12135 [Planctomycetota bacterium]|nr:MAG: hypothetical protein DWQ01_12135 [Planctomycetota bacterium]